MTPKLKLSPMMKTTANMKTSPKINPKVEDHPRIEDNPKSYIDLINESNIIKEDDDCFRVKLLLTK